MRVISENIKENEELFITYSIEEAINLDKKKPLRYQQIAFIKLSESTGQVLDVKIENGYTVDSILKGINPAVANGNFVRDEVTTYASIILSNRKYFIGDDGKPNPECAIRFPRYYKLVGKSREAPSATVVAFMDALKGSELVTGDLLLVPFIYQFRELFPEHKDIIGHMAGLILHKDEIIRYLDNANYFSSKHVPSNFKKSNFDFGPIVTGLGEMCEERDDCTFWTQAFFDLFIESPQVVQKLVIKGEPSLEDVEAFKKALQSKYDIILRSLSYIPEIQHVNASDKERTDTRSNDELAGDTEHSAIPEIPALSGEPDTKKMPDTKSNGSKSSVLDILKTEGSDEAASQDSRSSALDALAKLRVADGSQSNSTKPTSLPAKQDEKTQTAVVNE